MERAAICVVAVGLTACGWRRPRPASAAPVWSVASGEMEAARERFADGGKESATRAWRRPPRANDAGLAAVSPASG